ncbi:MAG: efflux RND transporter periplasmic adaptor subunit [Gammaproteobacteria bacterium]|nr:MAG: efflux RND transporter periplasmic adaptor subunit [Gammaproteobacteria bacterium]
MLLLGLALLAAAVARAAEPPPAVRVERERVPLERYVDGTIEAVNQGTISAQTSGRVREVLYDVNDFMPAGAVIVRLHGTEQRAGLEQAEAALAEATTREAEAAQQFDRVAALLERRLVSRQQYDQALAARDAAVARSAAARGALAAAREGVRYTEIRAPYAAVVARRHIEVGEAVAPGTPLLSGLSLQFLRVNVDLPQGLVGPVRELRRAAIHVAGRRIEATRLTLSPQAEPESGTFRVRLDLPENAADLYPGMLVKVAFVVGETERLLIPAGALVERSELQSVYVLGADDRIALRQVRTGHRFDDRIEVLAGLLPGERVVTDPLAALAVLRDPSRRALAPAAD